MMDVGGTDDPLDEALMPFISVIAPNESELTFVSGVSTSVDGKIDADAVRDAVAALKAKFAKKGNKEVEVLVTLGSMGSMHFGAKWTRKATSGHETRVGCYGLATPDKKPKDTTGAGDCFRGSH